MAARELGCGSWTSDACGWTDLLRKVDAGSVTSLRNERSCGNVMRLIMGSEAIVTSEEMRSSEAMRIL